MTQYQVSSYSSSRGSAFSGFQKDVVSVKPALMALARIFCRNDVDAEDLVQDTFVKAFANQEKFAPGTNLKAWLSTIMRRLFYSQYRSRKREPVTTDEAIGNLAPCMPVQDWVVYQLETQRLINKMSPERRFALIQISAGMSYEETAVALGCEVGTVKSRVGRARASLAAEMGDIFKSPDFYIQ